MFLRTAGAIRGRCGRVCAVVTAEMDNYEPGYYTERVLDTVSLLSGQVMPNFAAKVEGVIGKQLYSSSTPYFNLNYFSVM